ncbi:MAG: PD-(D/E)XK nuclease family protein [Rickettsiaceae bacterium]|nr:PD-(D/E)XK nuclease family protein [Rickettsiaceae bacterium]
MRKKVFQSNSKFNFLEEVAQIAINNSAHDFTKLKILLPTGLACSELQKILVTKLGTCILPKIIPISELIAESEEIFKIPSEQVGSISRLEEKVTLALTINKYKPLGYDLVQSLRLSPSLANLFFELEANNINLEEIKQLPILDQPEHWHKIHDFLSFAFDNWQIKIQSMKKMTRASYQKLMFKAEIQRLCKDPSGALIIAGLVSNNLMTSDFIKTASDLDNCQLIVQPEIDLEKLPNNINYVEFENIAHEAEYIALRCASQLNKNPKSRIALIAHNQYSKEQYQIFLDKYSLSYKDQFGENILNQHSISLILIIAELLYNEFDLKKFFTFLAHPMINSLKSQELKNIIRKTNKFAPDLEAILSIIENNGDKELLEHCTIIIEALTNLTSSTQFSLILKNVIKVAEKLVPAIWQNNQDVIALITEIVQLNCTLEINNIEDCHVILRQIIEGGRLFPINHEQQIIICPSNSPAFIEYDLIIITDLNEGSYPNIVQNNPWLSKNMQTMIGLDKRQIDFDKALYDFYMNIQNQQVLLTRAKKHGTNKLTLPSPFILKLKHILERRLETTHAKRAISEPGLLSTERSSRSETFPDVLYATDIETLIRAPYNFYAKKILKLRKIEEIDERPNLAEFGNFFHRVVEHYTKNYNPRNVSKSLQIISIAESILEEGNVPDFAKKMWKTKIKALADEFIKFDDDRRENAVKVYSEIQGETTLDIKGKNIILKAIADRIEVNHNDTLAILDFKTGTLPTKKDVLSGLSPQLLVEAIIAFEGGFPLGSEVFYKTELVLTYVKIGSSSPYVSTSEIILSFDEIMRHKAGLTALLEHYMSDLEFAIEPSLMKYDDYSHLARRNKN